MSDKPILEYRSPAGTTHKSRMPAVAAGVAFCAPGSFALLLFLMLGPFGFFIGPHANLIETIGKLLLFTTIASGIAAMPLTVICLFRHRAYGWTWVALWVTAFFWLIVGGAIWYLSSAFSGPFR